MTKRLTFNKKPRAMPDGKRVQIQEGNVKLVRPSVPLKIAEIED